MNERLLEVMADILGLPPGTLSEQTTMADVPAWDSVMHLNLCLALEAEFGLTFSPEEMVEMTSVAAIRDHLAQRGLQ
jgi:acyl carrier protein